MRCFLWIFIFSLLLVPDSSFAEYYKYRDENGVIRFTDNILEVPKSQQENVEAYREIKLLEEAGEVTEVESMHDIAAKLQTEKTMLGQEFEQLEAERQQLEEVAKITRSEAENDAFEKKIRDYNLRLQQYEAKRLLFKEKVDTYNKAMEAQFK